MLKSTHQPAQQLPQHPLPLNWSEHTAPSGHIYYYNQETKQSTYVRPVEQRPTSVEPLSSAIEYHFNGGLRSGASFGASYTPDQPLFGTRFVGDAPHFSDDFHRRPRQPQDRPKSKHTIPGCAPWLLIKTRLGRRFVHNPDTKESFWRFPKDVIGGVVEYDIQEREKSKFQDSGPEVQVLGEKPSVVPEEDSPAELGIAVQPFLENVGEEIEQGVVREGVELSEEYEEVEVTDSEFEDDENPTKRRKADSEDAGQDQPVEFGEDDMARQLAEMGNTYQLDPGEYGQPGAGSDDANWEDGAEGLLLTEEEASAGFKELLDDFNVNPYTMWDTVVNEGFIVEDDRYTLLPNMKRRREVFAEWSTAKAQQHKLEKEKLVKQDPRIPYLAFLERFATAKLFWPEFRRKYKKEQELRDPKLGDKDREKLYRDYVGRITKCSEAVLISDLEALLKTLDPSPAWNRSTTLQDGLPPSLLADLRYVSLKGSVRDPLILAHIARLPLADEVSFESDTVDAVQQKKEQEKRELALKKRELQVEEERRRQEKDLRYGRGILREEERELMSALNVGKEGLRGQVGADAGGGAGAENAGEARTTLPVLTAGDGV